MQAHHVYDTFMLYMVLIYASALMYACIYAFTPCIVLVYASVLMSALPQGPWRHPGRQLLPDSTWRDGTDLPPARLTTSDDGDLPPTPPPDDLKNVD